MYSKLQSCQIPVIVYSLIAAHIYKKQMSMYQERNDFLPLLQQGTQWALEPLAQTLREKDCIVQRVLYKKNQQQVQQELEMPYSVLYPAKET